MEHNNTRRQKLAKLVKAQETKQEIEKTLDAWDILENMAGIVDAPSDRSSEHDHYLYNTPKRNVKINVNLE